MGWWTFILLMCFPVLAVPLLTVFLFYFRADVKASGHLPSDQANRLWLTHFVLFLAGFFLVDGGDTSDSIGSVFTNLVGPEQAELSGTLFAICSSVGGLLLALCIINGLLTLYSNKQDRQD